MAKIAMYGLEKCEELGLEKIDITKLIKSTM